MRVTCGHNTYHTISAWHSIESIELITIIDRQRFGSSVPVIICNLCTVLDGLTASSCAFLAHESGCHRSSADSGANSVRCDQCLMTLVVAWACINGSLTYFDRIAPLGQSTTVLHCTAPHHSPGHSMFSDQPRTLHHSSPTQTQAQCTHPSSEQGTANSPYAP